MTQCHQCRAGYRASGKRDLRVIKVTMDCAWSLVGSLYFVSLNSYLKFKVY